MPAADLDLLIEAALESGRIATRFSGAHAKRWDKPDGAGPVTEADLAVNEMLEDRLPSARPDYGWLSEETEDNSSRLSKDRVFIVDPIDGTRSFAEGAKTWAHSLAIADHGIVTAAVIYLPLRDLLYTAEAGKGAQLNGVPICISEPDTLSAANLLAAKAPAAPLPSPTRPLDRSPSPTVHSPATGLTISGPLVRTPAPMAARSITSARAGSR